ncbi:major facilitator superfamily transporter [Xylariaceae sp. FL0804]|nr:major facilitator superfamily transporter [Xylariaceae sp. FL0804]
MASESTTTTTTMAANPETTEKPTPPGSGGESALNSDDSDDGPVARQPSRAESTWASETMSFPREVAMVAVICMAQFATQVGYIQALALMHVIGDSFGVTDPSRLSWLVAAYSLTVGTFILFSGRLGDAFGYKRMLVVGFAWFAAWCVVEGASVYSDFVLAVFARAVMGLGPAVLLPNALAILGAVYPPGGHRKAMVFAFFGAVAPMGGITGAIASSAIAVAWWPWALWALAIWLAALAVAARFVIPDLPPPRDYALRPGWSARSLAAELDLVGAAVGVAALVLFNFAWNQAPVAGWAAAQVLAPLVLGLALFALFLWYESRCAARPLLPFDAVNADVAFVLGVVVLGWATFGIWTTYQFQMLEEVRGLTPLLASVWFAPAIVCGGLAAVITGKLLGPLQVRPPVVMTTALAAFTIGICLSATAPPTEIYWGRVFFSCVVMPFGMDMSFPAATLILSNAVKKEHQGIGASLVNTVVNYGIALGVGFAGTVETHVSHGDEFIGYRGALYMGIGLSSLGFGICIVFLVREHLIRRKQ